MSVTVSPQVKVVGLTLRVMSGVAMVKGVGVGAEVRVALTPRGVLKALGAWEGDEAPEGAGLLVETGPAETEACCGTPVLPGAEMVTYTELLYVARNALSCTKKYHEPAALQPVGVHVVEKVWPVRGKSANAKESDENTA